MNRTLKSEYAVFLRKKSKGFFSSAKINDCYAPLRWRRRKKPIIKINGFYVRLRKRRRKRAY